MLGQYDHVWGLLLGILAKTTWDVVQMIQFCVSHHTTSLPDFWLINSFDGGGNSRFAFKFLNYS